MKYVEKINCELKQIFLNQDFFNFSLKYDFSTTENFSAADYQFMFEKKNLFLYYSEGINKVALIFLELAFINYYRTIFSTKEIFLFLDDIFAHLDNEKISLILSVLESQNLNV